MFKFLVSFLTIALFCVSLSAPSYGAQYGGGTAGKHPQATSPMQQPGGLTQQQKDELLKNQTPPTTQVPGGQGRY